MGWSITSASEDTLQKNGQGQNPSILLSFQLSPLAIKYWLGLGDSAPTTKPLLEMDLDVRQRPGTMSRYMLCAAYKAHAN